VDPGRAKVCATRHGRSVPALTTVTSRGVERRPLPAAMAPWGRMVARWRGSPTGRAGHASCQAHPAVLLFGQPSRGRMRTRIRGASREFVRRRGGAVAARGVDAVSGPRAERDPGRAGAGGLSRPARCLDSQPEDRWPAAAQGRRPGHDLSSQRLLVESPASPVHRSRLEPPSPPGQPSWGVEDGTASAAPLAPPLGIEGHRRCSERERCGESRVCQRLGTHHRLEPLRRSR
jgi:hypothetical protein